MTSAAFGHLTSLTNPELCHREPLKSDTVAERPIASNDRNLPPFQQGNNARRREAANIDWPGQFPIRFSDKAKTRRKQTIIGSANRTSEMNIRGGIVWICFRARPTASETFRRISRFAPICGRDCNMARNGPRRVACRHHRVYFSAETPSNLIWQLRLLHS